MQGRPITDEEKAAITALYKVGRKKEEITAAVGLSEAAVRKVLIDEFGRDELLKSGFLKFSYKESANNESVEILKQIDSKLLALGQMCISSGDETKKQIEKTSENIDKWLNLIEQHLSILASAKQEELQLLRQISKHTK